MGGSGAIAAQLHLFIVILILTMCGVLEALYVALLFMSRDENR